LGRLCVHGDVWVENRLFVVFVVFILCFCVCNVLWEKGFCGEFVFDGVFLVLSWLKLVCVGGSIFWVLCLVCRGFCLRRLVCRFL